MAGNDQDGRPVLNRISLNQNFHAKSTADKWNNMFFLDSRYFHTVWSEEAGRRIRVPNATAIKSLIERFNGEGISGTKSILRRAREQAEIDPNTLSEDRLRAYQLNEQNLRAAFINLLHDVGINADRKSIDLILSSRGQNNSAGFLTYLTDQSAGGSTIFDFFTKTLAEIAETGHKTTGSRQVSDQNIFNSESAVKDLATAWNLTHTSRSLLNIEGPDGKPYYLLSLTHYLSENIKRLKANNGKNKYIDRLLSKRFHSDSVWLNGINSGEISDLSLTTPLMFSDSNSNSDDIEWNSTNDHVKITAAIEGMHNGTQTLQVPSDSKLIYFLKGIQMHKARLLCNTTGEGNNLRFTIKIDNATLGRAFKYMQTEWAVIREAFQADGGIKGYDSYNKKANGVPGRLFRAFDLAIPENLRESFGGATRLNEVLSKARSVDDDTFKAIENIMNSSKLVMQMISDNILEESNVQMNKFIKEGVFTPTVPLDEPYDYRKHAYVTGQWSINSKYITNRFDNGDDRFVNKTQEGMILAMANFGEAVSITTTHAFNMIEYEKVFGGDRAFYGTYIDMIKRSSMPRTTFTPLLSSLNINDYNDSPAMQQYIQENGLDEEEFEEMPLRDEFIKIYNIERITELCAKARREYLLAKGLPKEQVDRLVIDYANGISKSYGATNWADGAAFASPELMKQIMLRRGVNADVIQDVFDFFEDPNLDIYNMDKSQQARFAKYADLAFGPQKMAYIGLIEDGERMVPNINKMAVFPLFRSLVRGTQLQNLYNTGINNETGKRKAMLYSFESAKKVGFISRAKNSLFDVLDNPVEFNPSTTVTTKLRYDEFGHQLNTDPHDDSHSNLGIQVKKIVNTMLVPGKLYGEYTGQQIIDATNILLEELSEKGFSEISKIIGADRTQLADGTYQYSINKEKFIERFLKPLMESEDIGKDVIDQIANTELSLVPDMSRLESPILSKIMKAVMNVAMHGHGFIQTSSVGSREDTTTTRIGRGLTEEDYRNIKAYKIGENERRVNGLTKWLEDHPGEVAKNTEAVKDAIRKLNKANRELTELRNLRDTLPIVTDKNGNNSGGCIISINLFKDILPAKYKDKRGNIIDFKGARTYLLDNIHGLNEEGKPNIEHLLFSYRVPVQSIASMGALHIVDFLPPIMGDAVILPDAWTTINGSDFDIDKIFICSYNYKDKDGKLERIPFIDYWAKDKGARDENRKRPLNERLKEKLQALYPEIKLDMSNKPKFEEGDNIFNQFLALVDEHDAIFTNIFGIHEGDKAYDEAQKSFRGAMKKINNMRSGKLALHHMTIKSLATVENFQALTSMLINKFIFPGDTKYMHYVAKDLYNRHLSKEVVEKWTSFNDVIDGITKIIKDRDYVSALYFNALELRKIINSRYGELKSIQNKKNTEIFEINDIAKEAKLLIDEVATRKGITNEEIDKRVKNALYKYEGLNLGKMPGDLASRLKSFAEYWNEIPSGAKLGREFFIKKALLKKYNPFDKAWVEGRMAHIDSLYSTTIKRSEKEINRANKLLVGPMAQYRNMYNIISMINNGQISSDEYTSGIDFYADYAKNAFKTYIFQYLSSNPIYNYNLTLASLFGIPKEDIQLSELGLEFFAQNNELLQEYLSYRDNYKNRVYELDKKKAEKDSLNVVNTGAKLNELYEEARNFFKERGRIVGGELFTPLTPDGLASETWKTLALYYGVENISDNVPGKDTEKDVAWKKSVVGYFKLQSENFMRWSGLRGTDQKKGFKIGNTELGPFRKVRPHKKLLVNGEPRIMYHGGYKWFDEFSKDKFLTGEGAMAYGAGFYFTTNSNEAYDYSKGVQKSKGVSNRAQSVQSKLEEKADRLKMTNAYFIPKALELLENGFDTN
jgi:hypothetical protein